MVQIDLGERLIRLADRVLSKNSNEIVGKTGGITNLTATDTSVPTTKATKEYVDEQSNIMQTYIDSQEHGNIKNNGAIGSVANKPIITTTNGVLTTGSFGTTENTFAEGNHVHNQYAEINDLSTIANTGSYNDLSDKPYIPTKTSDLTNDSNYIQTLDFSLHKVQSLHDDSIILYANDFFCYVIMDWNTASYFNPGITLEKEDPPFKAWDEWVNESYRPSSTITAVSEEGTGGREVLVQIKPDGSIYLKSLAKNYATQAYIIKCVLFWPRTQLIED